MVSLRPSILKFSLIVAVLYSAPANGEIRKWTSAKTGKTIEAEFLSADVKAKTITIKVKGKKRTIPISAFSKADRKYVVGQVKQANKAKDLELAVKRSVTKFYMILAKSEKDGLGDVLTSAAKKTYESNKTFFDQITTGDRGTKARVKKVDFKGKDATALTSLKFRGKYYDLDVGLKKEDEKWLIESLTFENEEGQKQRMDFATGQTVDPETAAAGGNEFVAANGRDGGDGYNDAGDGYGRGRNGDGYAAAGPPPKGRGGPGGPPPPNGGRPPRGERPPNDRPARPNRPAMEDSPQDVEGNENGRYSREGYEDNSREGYENGSREGYENGSREGYQNASRDGYENGGEGYEDGDGPDALADARQRAGGPPPGYGNRGEATTTGHGPAGHAAVDNHNGGHGAAATTVPTVWSGPPPFALPPQLTAVTTPHESNEPGREEFRYDDQPKWEYEDSPSNEDGAHGNQSRHGSGHGAGRDPSSDADRDSSDLDG